MPTDPLDLVDPLRLLLLLLPERYRAPVGAAITLAIASQALAASIVSRLPLSAREHPRYGRVVRALHWYSVLRLRDEKGTVKAIGSDVAPRVTPAPTRADEVALPRPPAPAAIDALRGPTLMGREPDAAPFDPQARQTIAPPGDGQRGSASVRSLLAVVVTLTVVLPLGVALSGCPNWNRPACTTPGAYSCVSDQPTWCSTTRELTPIGDEPCAAQGRVCGLRADGRAGCLRTVDGGAQ